MTIENPRIIRTKAQWETKFREENPTIVYAINEELTTLSSKDYETTIAKWIETAFKNQEESIATEEKEATDKAAAQAKLAALGLTADDLKALGL